MISGRENYDSYGLVMEHKNLGSQVWNYNAYMDNAEEDYLCLVPHRWKFRKWSKALLGVDLQTLEKRR